MERKLEILEYAERYKDRLSQVKGVLQSSGVVSPQDGTDAICETLVVCIVLIDGSGREEQERRVRGPSPICWW